MLEKSYQNYVFYQALCERYAARTWTVGAGLRAEHV